MEQQADAVTRQWRRCATALRVQHLHNSVVTRRQGGQAEIRQACRAERETDRQKRESEGRSNGGEPKAKRRKRATKSSRGTIRRARAFSFQDDAGLARPAMQSAFHCDRCQTQSRSTEKKRQIAFLGFSQNSLRRFDETTGSQFRV